MKRKEKVAGELGSGNSRAPFSSAPRTRVRPTRTGPRPEETEEEVAGGAEA
jgi:hypothetical protein